MDHEEMRKAYIRALDLDKTDFSSFCNDCKVTYLFDTGKILYVRTALKTESENTTYKLWYCSVCSEKIKDDDVL